MTIQSDASGLRQKEILTKWPVVEGDTLGTTKIEGKQINLVPEEGTTILESERVGL